MPGRRCAVASCKNNQIILKKMGLKVIFHTFPMGNDSVSSSIRKKWVRQCKRADAFNVKSASICSDHFKHDDYERDLQNELLGLPLRKNLKKTAVPTVNLGHKIIQETTRDKRTIKRNNQKMVDALLASSSSASDQDLHDFGAETVPYYTIYVERDAEDPGQTESDEEEPDCDKEEPESDEEEPGQTVSDEEEPDSDKEEPDSDKEEPESDEEEPGQTVSDTEQPAQIVSDAEEVSFKKKYETLLQKYNKLQTRSGQKIRGLNRMLKHYKNKFHTLPTIKTAKLLPAEKLLKKVLTQNQIDVLAHAGKMIPWTHKEMSVAFTLRYYSEKCYMYLHKHLNYPLPASSSLKRWASSLDIGPGLLKDVLFMMKLAGEDFTECERTVVLQFNEMQVNSVLEYDVAKDQVLGPHNRMLVVQARGLFSNWKQPIHIAFDQKVTKDVLMNIISKLHDISYNVVACVSDCGVGSIGLWSELQVCVNKPFFSHPNTADNVYVFADAPHLLKLVRNWLFDTGFILNSGEKITKEPLQALVELTNEGVDPCWKITQTHLDVAQIQRQNVELAAQVLSNSVSTALKKYKPGNDPKNAEDLGEFIGDMNNWFDIFNSYVEDCSEPTKSAYGDQHLKIQNKHLDKMISKISGMRAIGKKTLQGFQKGMIISIKSLKLLFQDMKEKYDVQYICTRKLNQDALENVFSLIRCQEPNEHPSPLAAIYRMRLLILGENAETLDARVDAEEKVHEEFLTPKIFERAQLHHFEKNEFQETVPSNSSTLDGSGSTLIQEILPEMTEDALEYIAGWLAKKYEDSMPNLGDLIHKFNTDHNRHIPCWVQQLSFRGLVKPTPQWLEKIKKWNNYFEIYQIYHERSFQNSAGVVAKLAKKIKRKDDTVYKLIFDFCKLRTIIRINFINYQAQFPKGSKRRNTGIGNTGMVKKMKKYR